MSTISIPARIIRTLEEQCPGTFDETYLDALPRGRWESVVFPLASHDTETLEALCSLLDPKDPQEKGSLRIVESTIRIRREGHANVAVKSLPDFAAKVAEWVKEHAERGWLVKRETDGSRDVVYLPWKTTYEPASERSGASVSVSLAYDAPGVKNDRGRGKPVTDSLFFDTEDLFIEAEEGAGKGKRRRVTVAEALATRGYYAATSEDVEAHDETARRFWKVLSEGFAQQYLHTGLLRPKERCFGYGPKQNQNAKVVHDVDHANPVVAQMTLWGTDRNETPVFGAVPVHPALDVFDLATQEYSIVDVRDLVEYVYDQSLRNKLVLPETHRELLDVLTTGLDDYTADIIDGKSAGNVILTRGRPGVGKTLTAEVYAETIERPLYAIHSGSLGITADSVRERLEVIFQEAARWNAVLLLDEADVFVVERGTSISQNAIVAEFLRTLEYFTGLMFMTTNRAEHIDDAILSRCAAIITYSVPEKDDARKVWDVLVTNAGADEDVPPQMRDRLVETYPHLAPRDIKMVLRLALRIAKKNGEQPDMDVFARCILFRGLTSEGGQR